jgi:5-methylthioribose kinase
MIELTAANAEDYLRGRGWVGEGPVRVEPLGWGVSNVVLRVTTPERVFVLKQSRPQLRTRDAWFSDLERVYREQEVMEVLNRVLPEPTVPRVLCADRASFVLAMSHAPAGSRVWKETLLAGEVDREVGRRAGAILGQMHEATAGMPALVGRFRDHRVFVQLRVEPFYDRIRQRRPEVGKAVASIVERMLATAEALCHGDYSPKNILTHERGFTLVDYETAHQGDPTMDLGFFLSHLLLKAAKNAAIRQQYFELTRVFWDAYAEEIRFRPRTDLEARGIEHFGVCLLARIDGTSPVDYLPEEPKREAVRRVGRCVLLDSLKRWDEVLAVCESTLAPLS